jgi:Polyketide cyclase / dehydrase and lipid transport
VRVLADDRGVERRTRVTGPLPPEQVWERYAVPARWPGWAPQIRAVDASAARIGPGVTGRVHGLLGVRVSFVVTEVDERARTWAWDVRLGPLRMHLRHGVDTDPVGTATRLVVRGPALAVAAYLPVARHALHRLVRA